MIINSIVFAIAWINQIYLTFPSLPSFHSLFTTCTAKWVMALQLPHYREKGVK